MTFRKFAIFWKCAMRFLILFKRKYDELYKVYKNFQIKRSFAMPIKFQNIAVIKTSISGLQNVPKGQNWSQGIQT